jgi:hypothetical protein
MGRGLGVMRYEVVVQVKAKSWDGHMEKHEYNQCYDMVGKFGNIGMETVLPID